MSKLWKSFWSRYRSSSVTNEEDLFIQVGRTVNGSPESKEAFRQSVDRIIECLSLTSGDTVVEYCCGNGLVSFELAPLADKIIAMDFSEHLIQSAQEMRRHPSIEYYVADALDPLTNLQASTPSIKFLMANALGHFEPADLSNILKNAIRANCGESFCFFATGIPDADRKWNFYDTPERKQRYLENMESANPFNDGLGRWWLKDELCQIANELNLEIQVTPENAVMNDYRMDALFYST